MDRPVKGPKVSTQSLRNVLLPLVQQIDRERREFIAGGHNTGHEEFHKGEQIEPLGGCAWVAAHTGSSPRSIRSIMTLEWQTVAFTRADRLLTQLGLPHRVRDLEILEDR